MQHDRNDRMQILGAGFGRSGTNTLMVALDMLGYKTYHMRVLFENPEGLSVWEKAADNKPVDWHNELYGAKQFTATCDFPSSSVYEDMMKQYPDAKVILTVRNAEKWYESASETIYQFHANVAIKHCFYWSSWMGRWHAMVAKLCWDSTGTLRGTMDDKNAAIARYNEWNEHVIKTVPKDKLLVLNIEEDYKNWDKLCQFLNKPKPDVPFPRTNDREEMMKAVKGATYTGYFIMFMQYIGIPAALIATISFFLRRR
jgi:hypothetical protein